MTRYEAVEQVFREYEKLIERWDQEWYNDRQNYPTEIFVNLGDNETLKANQQLVVKIRPYDDWADNFDFLTLINAEIEECYASRINALAIRKFKKNIVEAIEYIIQIVIWDIDCDLANKNELRRALKKSTISEKEKIKYVIGISNAASLLLYPGWKTGGYTAKLQTNYFLYSPRKQALSYPSIEKHITHDNYIAEQFGNKYLRKILGNWHKYHERFLKHEERLYGSCEKRDYNIIPPVILKDETESQRIQNDRVPKKEIETYDDTETRIPSNVQLSEEIKGIQFDENIICIEGFKKIAVRLKNESSWTRFYFNDFQSFIIQELCIADNYERHKDTIQKNIDDKHNYKINDFRKDKIFKKVKKLENFDQT